MDMITRTLIKTIKKHQKKGFINLIYGPRRVGKTVLLHQLTASSLSKKQTIWFNGDTREARESLSDTSEIHLKKLAGKNKTIIVDEAQRIPNIGLSLKILIDLYPEKTFYVSGSSSLELSRGLQEPLTGRTQKYRLFPLSTRELSAGLSDYQLSALLDEQLIFGAYPYLQQLNSAEDKKTYLHSIVNDYLFRDIFLLKNFDQPENIQKLASLLAFQIGSEVSLNELACILKIDVKTVSRYISLLKQSFVIFEISSFAGNLRKTIAKSKKYYFWDLGIRNALTSQFMSLDARTDIGSLWENFLAVERLKKDEYLHRQVQYYFWRNYQKAEIDWIETRENKLKAFEFKWQATKKQTPKAFYKKYKQKALVINKNNYLDFVG